MTAPLVIRLNPVQSRAHRAILPGSTTCLPWGRGGGKSWFDRLAWYEQVAKWDGRLRPGAPLPGVRIVLLMPTLKQAKRVHGGADKMIGELAPRGPWGFLGGDINRTDWRVSFPGGSWIQWVSAENARSNPGLRCDIIVVDECDDVEPEIYDSIILPYLSEHHSLRIRLLSGTPRRGRYGLLYRTHARGIGKLLTSKGDRFARHASFHATCHDFPEHVSPEMIEEARLSDPVGRIFRREWLCDFDAAEGLVYDLFDEGFHVREAPAGVRWNEVLVGGDFGYQAPGCFLVIGVASSGEDALCFVLEEVYAAGQPEAWWVKQAQRIERDYPGASWYHDPSMPARIDALKDGARVNIRGADNDVDDGIACVANALAIRAREDETKYAQLYVSPRCVNTIWEFGLYRRKRDPKNREIVLETIEKKNDHAMDTLRYALFSHFGKPAAKRLVEDPYGGSAGDEL